MRSVIVLGALAGCGFSVPAAPTADVAVDAADLLPTEPPAPCSTWAPDDGSIRLCIDFEDSTLISRARDGSGHNHDAMLASVAMMMRETAGTKQQALGLAMDSSVVIAEASDLDASSNFTFGLWVFASATPQQGAAPIGLMSNGGEYGIALQPDGDVRCTVGDKFASTKLLGAPLITLNRWVHIACTYDGAQIKVYLNGVLSDCKAAPIPGVKPNTSGLVIGDRNDGLVSAPLIGGVDNVHVYARALTAVELCGLNGIPAAVCIQQCL
ncbi:MAG: LamG domain-containing protein [Kofleriaceae bacterium]